MNHSPLVDFKCLSASTQREGRDHGFWDKVK